MNKVWDTIRTLGVLLGLWAILAIVAIVMNEVPQLRRGTTPPADAADAGVELARVELPDPLSREPLGDGIATAETDSIHEGRAGSDGLSPGEDQQAPGVSDERASSLVLRTGLDRWDVCGLGDAAPSLHVAHLFGTSAPELVVGCSDGWHVLAMAAPASGTVEWLRVGRFIVPDPPREQTAVPARAAHGDVDADGFPDIVLPLAYESSQGATRGGGLYLISTNALGGIREPVRLAPIAAVDARVHAFAGFPGQSIVALNRANVFAQLPSEAWLFGGGAAPARRAAVTVGIFGKAVRVTDLDRDGHADVVTLCQDRFDIHFGDGAGDFDRSHSMSMPGVREVEVGDLDGDGGADLLVLGVGLSWIRAGALDGMEPRGIDGVPAHLRDLTILDVNADGRADFVGWDHPRLVIFTQTGEVSFTSTAALELVGADFGPRSTSLADIDEDGATDDLVIVGSSVRRVEVVIAHDALSLSRPLSTGAVRSVRDAPLNIRAVLP